MKRGHITSSESRGCVKCRKKTSDYQSYEQSNIEVRIPLCDRCYPMVDVAYITSPLLKGLKKAIKDTEVIR